MDEKKDNMNESMDMDSKMETPEAPKAEDNMSGGMEGEPMASSSDVEENKLWAAISYLGILSVVVYLTKKDSPYAQFHARQGMVLFIVSLISMIPVIGWIIGIINLVFIVWGIINAASGKMTELPGVGQIAKKINF